MPGPLCDLPTPADADAAWARVRQIFDPRPKVDAIGKARDDAFDALSRRTGLPTPHDIAEYAEEKASEAARALEQAVEESQRRAEAPAEDDDDWGPDWTDLVVVIAGVYSVLSYELKPTLEWDFDIPAFEIDSDMGITVTKTRWYVPGAPFAARVADPLLHAGPAAPGPGNASVQIGKRPAMTTLDVSVCAGVTPWGFKHLPGPFLSTNFSVLVGGAPLLRAGDFVVETVGGPNPIVSGCPTVTVGKPAPPVLIKEAGKETLRSLTGYEKVGYTGGKVKGKVEGKIAVGMLLGLALGPVTTRIATILFPEPGVKGPIELDTGAVYAETKDEVLLPDLDGDGNPDVEVVRSRSESPSVKIKGKVTIEPEIPKVWKSDVGFEPDGMPEVSGGGTQYQTHPADEPPKPWKK